MPIVFCHRNIRFHFFSNEGDPREPMHIHADSSNGEAKIWLHPEVTIARSAGYNRKQITELLKVVQERREEIERAWYEHFS